MQEDLEKIGGITNQKAPLRNELTPINTKLAEACVLVQYILEEQAAPSSPSPGGHDAATTSKYFYTNYTPSPSVSQYNKTNICDRRVISIFPAIANDDYDIFQESFPLVERIWSELELGLCTLNTLVDETSRFGMCHQPTLDKDFCFHLAQISQQTMLMDLQSQVQEAESILHDTIQEYNDVQVFLVSNVMRRAYNIPVPESVTNTTSSLDIGQTPIALPKRKAADFPWHPAVREALDEVAHRIAQDCLRRFDPKLSLQMAEDSVHFVYTAFGQADTVDQQYFIKRRNRQAMIRLMQQQQHIKHNILDTIVHAPNNWQGLPKLTQAVERWRKVVQELDPNNSRPQVPLVEFATPFGGRGCITPHQLILQKSSKTQMLSLSSPVQVFDLKAIDLQATPKNPLTKLSILENGKKVAGCNPNMKDLKPLIQLVHVLKALQE
jgi:hypothetical protein